MKCISRKLAILLAVVIAFMFIFTGCSKDSGDKEAVSKEETQVAEEDNSYDVFRTSSKYGLSSGKGKNSLSLLSEDICVIGIDEVFSEKGLVKEAAEGAIVVNAAKNTAGYAQNIYEKLYPASTTKILTCLLALKYGDLDQVVTVSKEAASQEDDSSLIYIHEGDQITLRDLLYGLMLRSGNDAAVSIAETIGGSVDGFAEMMNEEALALGCSGSHFTNPHGYPDENHYTTVYDLYLIFQEAIKYEEFVDIISTMKYTAEYKDVNGDPISRLWENTNRYLTGDAESPSTVTVLGGKTGTTGAAKYCLVLLSKDKNGDPIISIVLKALSKYDLYTFMNQLLESKV